MKHLLLVCLCAMVMSSCTRRNLVYFDNLANDTGIFEEAYSLPKQTKIKTGDILAITVTSSSPETDILFNLPVSSGSMSSSEVAATVMSGYVVDLDGSIEFPVVGTVRVIGLTKVELADRLRLRVSEYLQDPAVNIRYLNTKVTVLGEVARPATFTVSTESITVLQALGLAGDMTVFGNREKVVVIREVNGERTVANLNLQDAKVLQSPYYFLQSNDVVYVEPVESRAAQASLSRSNISIALSLLSVLTFLVVGRR